jgi:hypothetical protein
MSKCQKRKQSLGSFVLLILVNFKTFYAQTFFSLRSIHLERHFLPFFLSQQITIFLQLTFFTLTSFLSLKLLSGKTGLASMQRRTLVNYKLAIQNWPEKLQRKIRGVGTIARHSNFAKIKNKWL